VEYSVGFSAKNHALTSAITAIPEAVWTPAIDADGEPRDGADVAEVTDLVTLTGWPVGMRVIVRREKPHPGAQLSLFEQADGWRYQAVATNTTMGQLAFLEARHRAHARVEDRIRHAKDTGLAGSPHGTTPSTRSGSSSPRLPPTWSPGFDSSPSPATSQQRSPSRSQPSCDVIVKPRQSQCPVKDWGPNCAYRSSSAAELRQERGQQARHERREDAQQRQGLSQDGCVEVQHSGKSVSIGEPVLGWWLRRWTRLLLDPGRSYTPPGHDQW
jgi:hypothetical protein